MSDLIPHVQIPPQSHSSLSTFETCPRQYEARYILKTLPYQETVATAWGNAAHDALEKFVKASGRYDFPDLRHPENGRSLRDYQWAGEMMLERAARRGGYVLAERSIAVDHNKDTTDYWDKQAWIRGKVDVTILYPALGEAEVFDYKSSAKKKADAAQLKLYSASAITDYSEVQTVKSGFIWLNFKNDGPVDRPAVYSRAELPQLWGVFEGKYAALQNAYATGVFPPKPSGLCKNYCGVEACEFMGRGRR